MTPNPVRLALLLALLDSVARETAAAAPPRTKLEHAERLLAEALAMGAAAPASAVLRAAQGAGISRRTLAEARRRLGVRAHNRRGAWLLVREGHRAGRKPLTAR